MKKSILLISMILWFSYHAAAQTTVITGKVTDPEDGSPLPGVSVVIKGTTNGTLTDVNGAYSLSVSPTDVIQFSYVGFQTTEIVVGSQTVINVEMIVDIGQLEEVIVVGYGEQKKVTVTGAVTAIKGKELTKSPSVNLAGSLSGRLPGLFVIQTSGEPGNENVSIRIRGQNTLGNSSPLVVIDGIPDRDGGIARVNPSDIESISVLKDASAAIYGARAANGVILLTTKKGETGKPQIRLDFNQGWQRPTSIPIMSNAVEYANIINQIPIYRTIPVNEWGAAWSAIQGTGTYTSPTPGISPLVANFSPEAVRGHGDGSNPYLYPDTDWFGDTFREWTPQSRYNLQISGGSENINYMVSLGYLHQDGIYKNSATKYDQYNLRVNMGAKISPYLKANIGVMARREDRNTTTESTEAIFRMLMRGRPTEPAVWPNGLPGPDIENGQQPVVITTNETGYNRRPEDFIQTNGSLEITQPWIDGLKLTLMGSIDHRSLNVKLWETPWTLYSWDRVSFEADGVTPQLEGAIRSPFANARLTQIHSSILNTNLTAMINYEKKIGLNHNIGILAGVTREKFTGEGFQAFRRDFLSTAVDQLFAGGAANQQTNGNAFSRPRLGYYGRIQYNYKEKFLAEFIWRRDGSYTFPANGRFGFFPGFLVGWNISQEDWFNVGAIDYLKLRASYGQMGNDQIFIDGTLVEFGFLSTNDFGEFPINGQVVTTLQETLLANPDFTWERAKNFNIGVDGTLFGGLIDFTIEYFKNKRDQILIAQTGSTPQSTGIADKLPPVNAGEVDNSGFEFSVLYNGSTDSDFSYRIGLNGGFAKNEVIFMDEVPGIPGYQKQEGKPIGAHFVYEWDGAFLDQAAIDAEVLDYSGVTSQLLPGDLRIRDINGDGIIDGDDQIRLDESNVPKFQFGATFNLTYKNFDLSMLFQGATGASTRIFTESGDIGNYLKFHHDNRWSIENPSDRYPRLASRGDTYYTGGNFGNNTYHLFDTDYLRLKNIEIGYNLPTSNKYFDQLRIYVNALNLFTIDSMDGTFDPEATSGNGQFYPLNKVINAGFTLTF